MPITHNLGRINTCQIVGTKNRFIEVRCVEEDCVRNCFECIDGDCVGQIGGQFDTMAECMANPLSNSCETAGMVDSGIYITSGATEIFYDWYFANHPNNNIGDYYYESDEPCNTSAAPRTPVCPGATDTGVVGSYFEYFDWLGNNDPNALFPDYYYECATCPPGQFACFGPNGGVLDKGHELNIKNAGGSTLQTVTSVGALVTWLNANGVPAALVTDGYFSLRNQWQAYAGGRFDVRGIPCQCPPPVQLNCCYGPNGGILTSIDTLQIVEAGNGFQTQIGVNFNSLNDLVVWANANGCPNVTTSMTYLQLITELSICLCNGQDSCAGLTDSGQTDLGSHSSWYIANQPSTPVRSWKFAYVGIPPVTDACLDDNGDPWYSINVLRVIVDGVAISPNFSPNGSWNDLINWMIAEGCTSVTLGMDYAQVMAEYDLCYPGTTNFIAANGSPCTCDNTGYSPATNTCDGKININSGAPLGDFHDIMEYISVAANGWTTTDLNTVMVETSVFACGSTFAGCTKCCGDSGTGSLMTLGDILPNICGPNQSCCGPGPLTPIPGLASSYSTWAGLLTDMMNLGVTGVTMTSTWSEVFHLSGVSPTSQMGLFQIWYEGPCDNSSACGGAGLPCCCTTAALQPDLCCCTAPSGNPCDITVIGSGDPCICEGCDSGPGATWECYEGAAGSYCADPLDGSGTFNIEQDCLDALAAGSIDDCDINGNASGAGSPGIPRTNAVPGTIFDGVIDVVEYYTDPANGISGLNAAVLYFEVQQTAGCKSGLTANTDCCEGPNSTTAIPTVKIWLPRLGLVNQYEVAAGTPAPCSYPSNQPGNCATKINTGQIGGPFTTYDWMATNGHHAVNIGNYVTESTTASCLNPLCWNCVGPNAGCFGYIALIRVKNSANTTTFTGTIINDLVIYLASVGITILPTDSHNTIASAIGLSTGSLSGGHLSLSGAMCECNNSVTSTGSCCPSTHQSLAQNNPIFITWMNNSGLGWGSMYGMGPGTPSLPEYFTYNQILNDCMIQGVTGVTMSTPMIIGGSTNALGTLSNLINSYLQAGGDQNHPCQNNVMLNCGNDPNNPNGLASCSVQPCISYEHCFCEEACSNITYECDPITGCYDPYPLLGTYTGANALANCQAVCKFGSVESYICVDGYCSDPGDGTGPHPTMADCILLGGSNNCKNKIDIGLGFAGTSADFYDALILLGLPNALFIDYWYEGLGMISDPCLSVNGFQYKLLYNINFKLSGVTLWSATSENDFITQLNAQCGCTAFNIGMDWDTIEDTIDSEFPATPYTLGTSGKVCSCTDCGGPDLYDCIPGAGCGVVSGGQYTTMVDCQSSTSFNNTCDKLIPVTTIYTQSGYYTANDMDSLQEWITTQANNFTNVDVTTLFAYMDASWEQNKCLPVSTDPCDGIVFEGNPQVSITPWVLYDGNTGATLPGLQASYVTWDTFIGDAMASLIPNIAANTTFIDAKTALIVWGNGLGKKAIITQDYDCCECTEGCLPPPVSSRECLVLWLDAADSYELELPSGPQPVPTPDLKVEKWYNKALPFNFKAYYTWDVIDNNNTTRPTYDTHTWAFPAIRFTNKSFPQYLIANPDGPAPPRLEPDTSTSPYSHGWTIFFHRNCSAEAWIDENTWFMGDDWNQDTEDIEKASGIKPEGQPYCESNYYLHNHALDFSSNTHESSALNEMTNTGFRTLQTGMWYLHWIVAEETKPYGNDEFAVTWGIGATVQFKDKIKGVDLDMVLANINTRNRAKDGSTPGEGWFSEVRAYNCAFDMSQINEELTEFETKYGTLNIPVGLPAPCGKPFVSTLLDGVDGTHIKVIDNGNITASQSGFTAAFWVKFNTCPNEDACLFEKGINLPIDNENVSFRLYLTNDAAYNGKLYWDTFGDSPQDYINNYSRTFSSVTWLGEDSCETMVDKWHHISVTMNGINGRDKKIYINGIDRTGTIGGAGLKGNVIRNGYPLNLGDSSRVDYTLSGNYGPFMTWNTELSADAIRLLGSQSNYFNPLINADAYQSKDFLSFYSKMDGTNLDLSPMNSEIVNIGGVTIDNVDIDPVNAGLPTDIKGLEIWLRAGTRMLADLDISNNVISRADYMLGNSLQIGDKLAIWECHANTGKYCAQTLQTYKPKYENDGTQIVPSNISLAKAVYTDGTDRLQIFNTRADGGINLDATNSVDKGAFTIMWRIILQESTIASESFMGDTSDNSIRMNNSTQIRVKLGGGTNKNFNLPSGVFTNHVEYIFTLDRDIDGILHCYVNGGAFNDLKLDGSGVLVETSKATIDHIIGIPGIGMKGWFFDLMCWKNVVLSKPIRSAMYRVMLEQIR